MSGRDATTCSSCGAPIVWRKNASTGKPAPIDAAPVEAGNLVLLKGGREYAVVGPPGESGTEDRPRYVNHFATCPNAARHHKPR